jgi:hypothetical protein
MTKVYDRVSSTFSDEATRIARAAQAKYLAGGPNNYFPDSHFPNNDDKYVMGQGVKAVREG